MPQTPHLERHFTAGETVRDIVIGMSDGLTVPFALAAGLSGAMESTAIVVTAGLAEVAAGAIAMGLGGYLAARSDAEHYASERAREQREVGQMAGAEQAEVAAVFGSYGLTREQIAPILAAFRARPGAQDENRLAHHVGGYGYSRARAGRRQLVRPLGPQPRRCLLTAQPSLRQGISVGLPDTAVREARGRVHAAIRNSGLAFPMRRITVNLRARGSEVGIGPGSDPRIVRPRHADSRRWRAPTRNGADGSPAAPRARRGPSGSWRARPC